MQPVTHESQTGLLSKNMGKKRHLVVNTREVLRWILQLSSFLINVEARTK